MTHADAVAVLKALLVVDASKAQSPVEALSEAKAKCESARMRVARVWGSKKGVAA